MIFTRGTTASLNLAAFSLGQLLLKGDDGADLRHGAPREHRSWHLVCERHGAQLKVIPVRTAASGT